MESLRPRIKTHLNIIGLYQIIGGLVGLYLLFRSIQHSGFSTIVVIFAPIIFTILFIYSIICGILCLKGNDLALNLSFTNQILQLLSIALLGFSFKYVSGLNLSLILDFTESLKFDLSSGVSSAKLFYAIPQKPFQIEFNLVALIFIFYIDTLFPKKKTNFKIHSS